MIPVLYAPSESSFLSNGLGSLSDTISCIVTEERNGAYTLEMVYPVSGIHFSEIRHSALLKVIPSDGATEQLFRIYKITKPMNGRVSIYAEHISYQLSLIPAYPFTATTCAAALQGLKTNAAETCPFTFWTDKSVAQNYTQLLPESIRARLGGQQGSILDLYGGEFEWDNYMVKLHASRGADRGVTLRYGKNITDLQQEENIENTYTGVLPYWANSEGGNAVYASPVYSENAGNYPYKRTKTVDFSASFEEQPTAAQLIARAQAYIQANNIGIPKVSIKVSFVALWQTEEYKNIANLERVKLCDTLTIQFEKLGISATAKVVKTVYDVLKERYQEIEVGEAKSSLSERIVEQEQAIQEAPDIGMMQRAIENATAQITGAKGGHVRFVYDGNDEPTELLIMNTADISTATKIWRWNLGGLGYSSTGYDGPYGTAITQDGAIVANFITTGTLNANLIRAGLLTDVAGKNSWNMVTGDLKLSASTAVGDSTIATQANITVNANAISAEVTRATTAEGNLSAAITVNADAIRAEASRASTAEGNLSSAITINANAISAEVSRASTAEGNLSAAITINANAITQKVSKGDVSSEISQEAGQITISSNRFVLSSTNCSISADGKITASNVDLTGKIKASSGEIGGFTITSNSIYSGSSSWGGSGTYLGSSGLSLKGTRGAFKVDSDGTTEIETTSNYPLKIKASGYTMYSYLSYADLGVNAGTLYTKMTNSELDIVNGSNSTVIDYQSMTIKNSTSVQATHGPHGITATGQGSTGYTISSNTDLHLQAGTLYKLTLEGKTVVVCDSTSDNLGFFGGNGTTKQTVGDLTATPTLDNLKSKLNSLIDALQAYNLIG